MSGESKALTLLGLGALGIFAIGGLAYIFKGSKKDVSSKPSPKPAEVKSEVKQTVKPIISSKKPLVFSLNGEKKTIPAEEVDPNITLAQYIRYNTLYKGTKIGCGEGGCGACVVNLARYDQKTNKVIYRPASSCLTPLVAVDGHAVTTTEGLGNSKQGFHPIQERIAQWNGNQCGFCTPGFVMSTYSALKEAQADGVELKPEEVEYRLDGNLCRCTGYRPILQAVKSLTPEGKAIQDDITHAEARVKAYDPSADPEFPAFLKEYQVPSARFSAHGVSWVRCTSLDDVFTALDEFAGQDGVRFVVGNTSKGIYKEDPDKVLIDVAHVPELKQIAHTPSGLSVGGSVTIGTLAKVLQQASVDANLASQSKVSSFAALARHVLRIAGYHVRGIGSVAGNLVMTKTKGFLSDLATILLGVDASVCLVSKAGRDIQPLKKFLADPVLSAGTLVESIVIPYTQEGDNFASYKAALRPQNAHAYVNAAFLVNIDEKDQTVKKATLAYGGIGEEDKAGTKPVRASKTEALLIGKPLNNSTLKLAVETLKTEIKSENSGISAAYSLRLVTGFFFRYFVSLTKATASKSVQSAAAGIALAPSQGGSQSFPRLEDDKEAVGKAIVRPGANALAAGETPFTSDIPATKETLYGAYVQAKIAKGKVLEVDTSLALAAPGVFAYIDAKDCPGGSEVRFAGAQQPYSTFFVKDNQVEYYGHPIGLIVADTTQHAEKAAKLVQIKYKEEKAIVTVKDIKEAQKSQPDIVKDGCTPYVRGDPAAALAAAKAEGKNYHAGSFYFGAQRHFALEPHTAFALPAEEGTVTVYNALQWPDAVHTALAHTLQLPQNKIRVILKRCGGGFGGKITANICHAAAAAVAAVKLKRPVAIHLGRNPDMQTSGGRHEVEYEYEFAHDNNGLITALKSVGLMTAGYSNELSYFCFGATATAADQCYFVPNWSMQTKFAWTNVASHTAVRAPGEIQGSFMIESIIEHVSAVSGVPAQLVRERNMYSDDPEKKDQLVTPNKAPITHYTVPKMWQLLKKKANIDARFAEIDDYNKQNRYKKRGLAMVPTRYFVMVFQKNALVNIYSDGTVLITQGGSDIGQGLFVKVQQVAASTLGQVIGESLPMSAIRFSDTDSNVVPNALFTGGSTASEGVATAVQRACDILVSRIKPIREKLEKKRGEEKKDGELAPITWQEIIGAARAASIDLSAEAQWAGAFGEGIDSLSYNNYGVAASEVELDVLTGEVELLRTDMLYDCGKSLNPAVDIGQAEGAFMMGVGNFLREKTVHSLEEKDYGRLVTDGTWKYKIPGIKDVPKVFNVEFIENKEFDKGFLSSKASGEPPLVLSTSVLMAVRYAIRAARKDNGLSPDFQLSVPATPENIAEACGTDPDQFSLV